LFKGCCIGADALLNNRCYAALADTILANSIT
jgi:hypothetical protein